MQTQSMGLAGGYFTRSNGKLVVLGEAGVVFETGSPLILTDGFRLACTYLDNASASLQESFIMALRTVHVSIHIYGVSHSLPLTPQFFPRVSQYQCLSRNLTQMNCRLPSSKDDPPSTIELTES